MCGTNTGVKAPHLYTAVAAWRQLEWLCLRYECHLCRSLFSCGTVQAAANALGGNVVQQVTAWRRDNAQLWASVADSCRAAPAETLTAALETFNQDTAARGNSLYRNIQASCMSSSKQERIAESAC